MKKFTVFLLLGVLIASAVAQDSETTEDATSFLQDRYRTRPNVVYRPAPSTIYIPGAPIHVPGPRPTPKGPKETVIIHRKGNGTHNGTKPVPRPAIRPIINRHNATKPHNHSHITIHGNATKMNHTHAHMNHTHKNHTHMNHTHKNHTYGHKNMTNHTHHKNATNHTHGNKTVNATSLEIEAFDWGKIGKIADTVGKVAGVVSAVAGKLGGRYEIEDVKLNGVGVIHVDESEDEFLKVNPTPGTANVHEIEAVKLNGVGVIHADEIEAVKLNGVGIHAELEAFDWGKVGKIADTVAKVAGVVSDVSKVIGGRE